MTTGIILYEFDYINPATGDTGTLRAATAPFTSKNTDALPNTVFLPIIRTGKAGSITSAVFKQGATYGEPDGANEDVELSNVARKLDMFRPFSFDFREARFWIVPNAQSKFDNATRLSTAAIEFAEFGWDYARFSFSDRLRLLDVPINVETFGGGNVNPNDIDGDPALAGVYMPCCYGSTGYFQPPLVNEQSLLFMTNFLNGLPKAAVIEEVDDAGVSIPLDYSAAGSTLGDYGSIDDLVNAQQSGAITSGYHATCNLAGAFALNNIVGNGIIRCRVSEGVDGAARTAAQATKRMVTEHSAFTAAQIEGDADLDAVSVAWVGRYIDDGTTTLLTVASELTGSAGGFIAPLISGNLGFGALQDPAPLVPLANIKKNKIRSGSGSGVQRIAFSDATGGVPTWNVVIEFDEYPRTVTESEAGGSVSITDKQDFKKQFRTAAAQDASVKATWLSSDILTLTTRLRFPDEAATFAADQLALRSVLRDQWLVPVDGIEINYDLGKCLSMTLPVYDMITGKKFIILEKTLDLNNLSIEYLLYG